MSDEPRTLPGALAAEISRVTDLRVQYEEAGRLTNFPQSVAWVIANINAALKAGITAAGSADIEGQARALRQLRGFTG